MNQDAIRKLTEAAKSDPQLFHALFFNPESVLSKLEYLDRSAKGRLVAIDPEQFIGDLLGENASDCTITVNCGSTCTHTASHQLDKAINPAVIRRKQ